MGRKLAPRQSPSGTTPAALSDPTSPGGTRQRRGLRAAFTRLNVVALAVAAAVRGFDAAYHGTRLVHAVMPDNLLLYNQLLGWIRHGDSPLGYTLTPAPYFLDMALELPLMLVAPDFEWFAYALALVYALLIGASLAAVLRVVLDVDRVVAIVGSAAALLAFYSSAPLWLVMHAFICNHTSEIFSTLGLVALVHAWFRLGAPRQRFAVAAYPAVVVVCVASSPFFIVTYCVPVAIAVGSLVGSEQVSWRRLAGFLGLTALGALLGLILLAVISRYAWPIRSDHWWQQPWRAYARLRNLVRADPRLLHIALAVFVGVLASSALAVVGRLRGWRAPLRFALAFYPAAVVAAIAVVIKRGAFLGPYELRYFHASWLLTCVFYVAAAIVAGRALLRRLRARGLPSAPRWLPWTAGALGAAGLALVATARGPLTMFEPASLTSPTVRCFADAERAGLLQDGVATVWSARYLNAARLAPAWQSPNVIVELLQSPVPSLHSQENNLVWLNGPYRAGRTKLNFLITHGLSDDALKAWRGWVGAPDRTIHCAAPLEGQTSFELWIWDRDDAQRRLAEIVTHSNQRGPFAPIIAASDMAIDVEWGMDTPATDGELVGRRRVWRRAIHRAGGTVAVSRDAFVPGGRYRLDLELDALPSGAGGEPVAEVIVGVEGAPPQRFAIAAGTHHASLEVELRNPGGATSGYATTIAVNARAAETIELSGMTLTLLALDAVSPFEIFR